MDINPPPICRQLAFNQEVIIDNLEIQQLEIVELQQNEQIINLDETIYRGINYLRKASSLSNLEELNKIPLIKKFNSF